MSVTCPTHLTQVCHTNTNLLPG